MQTSYAIWDRVTYHGVYDESILTALQFAHDHGFAGVQVAAELPHLDPTELTRLAAANVEEFCIEVRPRLKAVESLANLRAILDTGALTR